MRSAFDAEPLLRGAARWVTRPRLAALRAVHEHPRATTSCAGAIDEAEVVYWGRSTSGDS